MMILFIFLNLAFAQEKPLSLELREYFLNHQNISEIEVQEMQAHLPFKVIFFHFTNGKREAQKPNEPFLQSLAIGRYVSPKLKILKTIEPKSAHKLISILKNNYPDFTSVIVTPQTIENKTHIEITTESRTFSFDVPGEWETSGTFTKKELLKDFSSTGNRLVKEKESPLKLHLTTEGDTVSESREGKKKILLKE